MNNMLLIGVGEDDNVVNIDKYIPQSLEYVIDETLEHWGGISQSEWHPSELEEAPGSTYCSLFPVFRAHRNLHESLLQVDGREYAASDMLTDVIYPW